jgi:AcrR family transcriptional regulator
MARKEIRDKIIEESALLFIRYGIKSVTMDDIARHLSISKKTIYQFFTDREEIILSATKLYLKRETEELQEVERNAENAIDQLHKLSICMREKIRNLNQRLLFDLEKYHDSAWQEFLKYKRETVFDSLIRIMNKGIKEGYFRSDIQPEILARLRVEQIELSFRDDVFPSKEFKLSDIHEQLYDHFVHGILTEKGLQLLKEYQANTEINE